MDVDKRAPSPPPSPTTLLDESRGAILDCTAPALLTEKEPRRSPRLRPGSSGNETTLS
jgi:hypothetical protein